MRARNISLFILVILAALFSGCSNKDYPIAVIGSHKIYKSQFEKLYVPMKNVADEDNIKKADQVFENMLKQMTTYSYLEKNGLLSDEMTQMKIQSENSKLIEYVYNADVLNKVKVNEKEIYNQYKREKTTVWAQHILVKEEKLADSIYDILKKSPERFGELSALYSEDTNNKNNEGILREFSGGMMVKEFEDACMKLNIGVISSPVKTNFGFHIIRVNKRELKEMNDYEKEKKRLENTLKKKLIQERVMQSEKELRAVAKLQISSENINALFPKIRTDSLGEIMLDSIGEERSLILARSIFGEWNIDEVLKKSKINGFGKVSVYSADAIKNHIDKMIFFMTVYEKGKRMGGNLRQDFKKDIELKMAIVTEQKVMKDIRDGISTDDSTLINFYNKHQDKFMEKGKAGIYIISNDDSLKVQAVKDSLKYKKDFKYFARVYSGMKPKEFSKPDYYIFNDDDTTGYYKTAFDLGKKGMISEIFKNANGYNLIKVEELVKAKPFDLTPAFISSQLKNEYMRFAGDSIFNDEYAKAKESLKIEIYKDKYDELVKELILKSKETK